MGEKVKPYKIEDSVCAEALQVCAGGEAAQNRASYGKWKASGDSVRLQRRTISQRL
jgi:hypothetical protein